jgi:excisionase family DNA binding protein
MWLTVSEAARVAGLGPQTIRLATDTGRLPVERTEAGWRLIKRVDVEKFAAARLAAQKGGRG